ncbi:MAG: TIGR01244 family sulfur transferase [Woeseiaceae bacterium]
MTVYRLSENCAVASQIQPEDVAAIAAEGFTTIICNRPDGEDFGQPTASAIETACEAHDIAFLLMPIDRSGITKTMVEEFQSAVAASKGPVFAYCRSGQRSSVLWQASGGP